ncbi:hypothetical protein DH2020_011035 [Rehmannia glutinosa]|uniref:BHLH domain-containing protein n=1 Tax=Rehmannia glutinosa TaxID=99300 RepID=A0ABR0XCA0_REHGL
MVTAKESPASQQLSARNSPNLNQMAPVQLDQNYGLPYFSAAFQGKPNSDLCGLNTGRQNAFDKPIDASCAPQKRFLIFDRSGNHTRLFFSPSFSPQNRVFTSNTPASANGLWEKVASQVDDRFLLNPEKWTENDLNDGEGEMLDDTEEINALLYSDSDDEDDDDDDGENDEVTSMRHNPFSIEEGYDKHKLFNELIEEVASSDDSPKRQRLLDGRYKKSSLVSSCGYCKDDEEYSYVGARNSYDGIDSSKRDKKVKIHETLKILESIIPGLKSKDPVSIIEKAIVYLESMKIEAEALGLSYTESTSATYHP